MNTNLIMGLLIQLVTALKEPAPPVSGIWMTQPDTGTSPYQGPMAVGTNFYNVPSITNIVWGGTNVWKLIYTNSLIDWNAGAVSFVRTNKNVTFTFTDKAIRELAKSGRICEVLGHRWEGGRIGEGPFSTFADFHPGVTFRHCSICSVSQTKSEGDWK